MNTSWRKNIQYKVTAVATAVMMFAVPFAVRAQLEGGTAQKKLAWSIKNPIGAETIQQLIIQITSAMVLVMSPVIVLMLIYSGFLFVQGANDPDTLKKAKTTLLYTVIGAAMILGAKGIALAIQATIVQL